MRTVAIEHVTLDGVMQAPGRPDEDLRDGFEHGGWASERQVADDPEVGAAMGSRMAQSDGLILGRRTYEDLQASWNERGGPFKEALNNTPKFVASRTLSEPLSWPNSTLIGTDVVAEVGELRARPGRDLHILGSGDLLQSLLRDRLVDELLLLVHPISIGRGRRLFGAGIDARFALVDARPTTSGVIIANYLSAPAATEDQKT
jgi:dihydrofolate reductase